MYEEDYIKNRREISKALSKVRDYGKKLIKANEYNMSLNSIYLSGFLAKDPDHYQTPKYTTFTVAVSENYKDRNGEWKEKTNWIDCICWNPAVIENKISLLKKGHRVVLNGKLNTSTYDREDGTKATRYQVVVAEIDHIVHMSRI